MKKVLYAMLMSVLSGATYAQSSVTLYGDIGGGLRWTNGTKGGSLVGFNNNICNHIDRRDPVGGHGAQLFILDG